MVTVGQMPKAGVVVIWLLAFGGLGVFIYRRLKGIPIREPRPDDSPADPGATAHDPFAAPPTPLAPFPGDLAVPPNPADPTGPVPPATPAIPTSSMSPPRPTDPGGLFGVPAVAAPTPPTSEVRGGFFAPATGDAPGARPVAKGRSTVAEAVRGIVMPCGLAPIVDGSSALPNPFRVAFLSSTADAATVGSGLADELERLGFSLSTATPTELLARRDDIELRVVLYVKPATAKRGFDFVFPAAPDNSVGVELST